jgi:tRNA G10  N-methylase Trm11
MMDVLRNQIITGDCRELSSSIEDNSIDLIFTDPPYLKEFIPLYGWLAEEATRVLKPGGFCLAYAGVYWKAQVMADMTKYLDYFWDFVSANTGNAPIMWKRKIISRHKSILAFSKGQGLPRCNVVSMWSGGVQDKRFHVWGQDESTARYYIDCFSRPGELIWEPFAGGGTTLVACKVLRRNFIAYEIDPATALIARTRLEMTQPPLWVDPIPQLELMADCEVPA